MYALLDGFVIFLDIEGSLKIKIYRFHKEELEETRVDVLVKVMLSWEKERSDRYYSIYSCEVA